MKKYLLLSAGVLALGVALSGSANAGVSGTLSGSYASDTDDNSGDLWNINGSLTGMFADNWGVEATGGYHNLSDGFGDSLDIWNVGGSVFWAATQGRLAATVNYYDTSELGADLIYAVYKNNSGTAGMTAVVAYAKKLTQKDEFEKHASQALQVALELDRARVCSDYKELLPRATEFADSRSEKKLKSLNGTRGCGFLGVLDCYPCLRSGSELKDAIDAAGKREAPELPVAKTDKKTVSGEK